MAGSARDLFASLAPDERALHRWVAPRLDPAALEEIAAADYGVDVPEHRRALDDLVHSPWLPDRLAWHPGEVLALTRWGRPTDRRGHLGRLFACVFLVRAVTAGDDPVDSLGPLVDSAWELGEPARAAAVPFLAWCRLNLPGDWRDEPSAPMFLTLAILLLRAETPAATALAAVLLDELNAVLTDPDLPWHKRPRSPLFARRSDAASTRRLWTDLVTRCLVANPAVADPRLTALGRALGGDTTISIGEDFRRTLSDRG
ncbi:hypothetical protein Val02_31010 [Virgisporangium aliadipatigenens]|uniref:Uncharacterized protein n=1 Tax=Virgisporangium aliadipatigenens TaxID=741659 RepID=A0A8J3YLR6_9ACTN|nr:hypothetical protein [Virgisporangium aliadipatigenens]GIJ46215.1 hypothetical protein Val02_31010 [Virgisporangium aliadipatigenens]